MLAKRTEMDDNFQFGETGEVKKVSELFKYQNTENRAGNIRVLRQT